MKPTSILTSLLLLALLPSPCRAEDPPVFVLKWGTTGSGPGQFDSPSGIALSPSGEIFVTDSRNNRVQKFTANGVYLGEMGGLGTGNGRFYGPTGIAVDANGTVYVGDAGNSLIQVFDSDLHFVRQWTATAGGPLAADPTGQVLYEVYIGRLFTYDILTGTLLNIKPIGQYGEHQDPCGFALDPSGALLVSAHTWVLRLSPSGSLLGQWGSEGTGDGQFSAAKAVAVDGSGNVYVCDAGLRVQKFTANGDFITKWGTPGTQDGGFSPLQYGIVVDHNDAVFVLDSGLDRVQKFQPIPTEARSHSWGDLKALYR